MARITIVRITPPTLAPQLACTRHFAITARLRLCSRIHLHAACRLHPVALICSASVYRQGCLVAAVSSANSGMQIQACVCVPVHWYYAFYVFTSPLLSAGMHFMCFIRFICASGRRLFFPLRLLALLCIQLYL